MVSYFGFMIFLLFFPCGLGVSFTHLKNNASIEYAVIIFIVRALLKCFRTDLTSSHCKQEAMKLYWETWCIVKEMMQKK